MSALQTAADRDRGPPSTRRSIAPTRPIATFKQQYPSSLQFVYGRPKYEKPFFVRSIWHDGQFTYIKSDAPELARALRDEADGSELLNFQVQEGTYVVPKVLDRGVLDARQGAASGSARTVVMADPTPGTAPVTDHRTPPRGVLPRHTQTWLMVALALGILAIIVFTGRPQPASREAALTGMPARAAVPIGCATTRTGCACWTNAPSSRRPRRRRRPCDRCRPPRPMPPAPPPPSDPTEADRKRREYESLFASNVVISRRPDAQRLTSGDNAAARFSRTTPASDGLPTMPSLDDVADAVVRASARQCTARVTWPGAVTTGTSRFGHAHGRNRCGIASFHAADPRDRRPAPDPRRHRDRHRADEPARRHCVGSRQLSRHQRRLLARRTGPS